MHLRRASRLAAWFAASNMGLMSQIDQSRAGETGAAWWNDPSNEVLGLIGHFCESDEHEEIFIGEAEMWFENIKNLSVDEAREKYKHNDGREWFDAILSVPEETLEQMRGR